MVFTTEDLRGKENAPADFRASFKEYDLLFNIINDNELVLTEIENVKVEESVCVQIPSKIHDFQVTEIGDYAFGDDYVYFPTFAKYSINHIKEIKLPACIKTIGTGAFRHCGRFMTPLKIDIPNGVLQIEDLAFADSNITELSLPASVSYIGENIVADTYHLVSIKVDEKNNHYDSRENCNAIIHTASNKMIAVCKYTTFPASVTEIAVILRDNINLKQYIIPSSNEIIDCQAFAGCANLSEIYIPNSIVSIGYEAFSNCTKLKSIKVPDSVKEIGNMAFSNCDELTNIVIPSSVSFIGTGILKNCLRLSTIIVDKKNSIYDSRNNCNAIIETATNTLIQGCSFTQIPDTITKIGEYAFSGCHLLKSIELPHSVTEIADRAFEGCDNLETIIIPDSVKTIGDGVFDECPNLRKIVSNAPSILKYSGIPERAVIVNNTSLLQDNGKTNISTNQLFKNKQDSPYARNSNEVDDGFTYIGNYKYNSLYNLKYVNLFSDIDNRFFSLDDDYPFDKIIDKTMEIIRKGEAESFNKALFDSMNYYLDFFFNQKYIKFINIYNNTDEKQFGYVGFHADFSHSTDGLKKLSRNKKLITTKREEVDFGVGNIILGGPNVLTIEDLFRSNRCFGKMFEYCYEYSKPLLADEHSYFAIRNLPENEYIYNFRLGTLIYDQDEKLWQKRIDKFDNWLSNIDTCYDMDEDDITNFYFFISNSDKTSTSTDSDKYCICANIGVANWKTNTLIEPTIVSFLREFQRFIDQLSGCLYSVIKESKFHRNAVIGAIGKLMSRNMNHNIGSHVISNLRHQDVYQKLADSEVLKSNTYLSCFNNTSTNSNDDKKETQNTNLQLPYFFQYLNDRMDYLSDVTFGTPNVLTTKYMYNDVFTELDRVRILLNHISGIQDFKYSFCVKYNGKELSDKNDIAVAFSSDILGTQAFYNIIENIIRNTAKHAYSQNRRVVFTIELSDVENHTSYYCVEIDNGIAEEDIDNLVINQNKLIKESVLDENTNDLRDHGLGLLEMATSAAFLRQVDIEKVDSFGYRFDDKLENNKLILLKAINKKHALGYRFYLQKPKEFLFVGAWNNISETKKNELTNLGINFLSDNDFINSLDKSVSYPQNFLLYNESNIIKQRLIKDDTLLPLRKLKVSYDEIATITDIINNTEIKDVVEKLKEFSWRKYFNDSVFAELKNCDNKNIRIGTTTNFKIQDNGFSSNQVVFLHHGQKDPHHDAWKMSQEHNDCEAWIENLSSRTSTKLPKFYGLSDGIDSSDGANSNAVPYYCEGIRKYENKLFKKEKENWIIYSIFEAYHNKVIALDERIQQFSKENFEGSDEKHNGGLIPCSELFKSTNVHIPEILLDPKIFSEEDKTDLERFVDDRISGAFLLIHYGILERMYKNENEITKQLNAWASKAKRVVVTSGRGAHSLPLPPSVCFADLSSVLYAFAGNNRNKFTINDLLNQSRRKHE